MHPPCFDSQAQFEEWQRLAWETRLHRRFAFCTDCTPSFMVQMLKAKRCIRPDAVFKITKEFELEGYAPLHPSEAARKLMKDAQFA